MEHELFQRCHRSIPNNACIRRMSSASLLSVLSVFVLLIHASLCRAVEDKQQQQQPASLLQVTLLFRHGERTPVHTFPTDPYKSLFRAYGNEQLLEAGVKQHYLLGRYLRGRYKHLLPSRFNVTLMHVRSTDTDRTIMSAQANTNGLFPDQCSVSRAKGNSNDEDDSQLPACYPVPIHTVPKSTDQLLKMSSPCPAYTRFWRQFKRRPGGAYSSAGERFAWLAELARAGTGWPRAEPLGISELWKIADPVAVWRSLGLKLPDWLDNRVLAGLDELRNLKFAWKFSEPELYSSRMGALVAKLVEDSQARLSGKSNKILQVYSAHDSTVSAFLSAFGVFNNIQPPLAACVMLELYDNGEIKLFYRNSSHPTDPPQALAIPFCAQPCLVSKLATQMRRRGVWFKSGEDMCMLKPDFAATAAAATTSSKWLELLIKDKPIIAIQFVIIICLFVALVTNCLRKQQTGPGHQYQRLVKHKRSSDSADSADSNCCMEQSTTNTTTNSNSKAKNS